MTAPSSQAVQPAIDPTRSRAAAPTAAPAGPGFLERSRAPGWLIVIGLLALWEIVARTVPGFSNYLPPLSEVLRALWALTVSGEMPLQILATLQKIALGFLVGVVLGIPIGVPIGFFRPLYELAEPTLELLRPAPAIAILPLAVLLFGLDLTMQTVVIAWAAVWPILTAACDGVRNVDPVLIDTARAYGYGRWKILRRIVLPAATPYMMAGLRLAVTISLILAIFVEMYTAGAGLGYSLAHYREAIRIPEVYATILTVAMLGYALNALFLRVEARLIGWYIASQRGTL
jgi:ABC-type nitrate/sulfonate/bicarbonate transport system permease component